MNNSAPLPKERTPIVQFEEKKPTLLEKMLSHGELIAALTSGVLIVIANILEHNGATSAMTVLFLLAYIIGGFAKAKEGITETIEEKKLNVELLMIAAAIGAAIIGYWNEGAILIFIFAMSGALEQYTMNKSQKELSALMDLQPEEAWLVEGEQVTRIQARDLHKGDTILIKPGDRIPADAVIIKGESSIDESMITGEPIAAEKQMGDSIFAGTVNMNGSLTAIVAKEANETLFQKIIDLVQNAQSEKAPSQLFIERFENTYVRAVLVFVGIMMVVPYFAFGWSWEETFYRAMILLVVASPCALVASVMPASLSAISNGARKGILFKGGAHLEQLGKLKAIAMDKTGTLTVGRPKVTDFYVDEQYNQTELLHIIASIENHSAHPLATSIVKYYTNTNKQPLSHPENIKDVVGNGVECTIENDVYRIGKSNWISPEQCSAFHNQIGMQLTSEGKTLVWISKNDTVIAVLALQDSIRPDTKKAIEALQKAGIECIMITGDNEQTAKMIAKECGIKTYIAGCLPEEKVTHVESLRKQYGTVAMIGDGINDAPALATASVGIAMGEGTDVALETADVILMKNELTRIEAAVKLSKRMNSIVKQNIVFSISIITLLILSNLTQNLNLPLGVIGHEGSTILVILNGLRLLR